MEFGSPPYPALPLHLASDFAWSESFALRSRSALRCRTLSQSRPQLVRLVPLMGKHSVSNITFPLTFVVGPKALTMARLSVVASLLLILPLPPCRFCPLAPYYPFSWHLTAKNYSPAGTLLLSVGCHPTATHWLAPYCSPSAATLLLLPGWHPTAHRRWLASPLPGGSARPSPPLII